jgi:hypothetical protein
MTAEIDSRRRVYISRRNFLGICASIVGGAVVSELNQLVNGFTVEASDGEPKQPKDLYLQILQYLNHIEITDWPVLYHPFITYQTALAAIAQVVRDNGGYLDIDHSQLDVNDSIVEAINGAVIIITPEVAHNLARIGAIPNIENMRHALAQLEENERRLKTNPVHLDNFLYLDHQVHFSTLALLDLLAAGGANLTYFTISDAKIPGNTRPSIGIEINFAMMRERLKDIEAMKIPPDFAGAFQPDSARIEVELKRAFYRIIKESRNSSGGLSRGLERHSVRVQDYRNLIRDNTVKSFDPSLIDQAELHEMIRRASGSEWYPQATFSMPSVPEYQESFVTQLPPHWQEHYSLTPELSRGVIYLFVPPPKHKEIILPPPKFGQEEFSPAPRPPNVLDFSRLPQLEPSSTLYAYALALLALLAGIGIKAKME